MRVRRRDLLTGALWSCAVGETAIADVLGGERLFYATLAAGSMTTLTHSKGTGRADFRVDLKALALEWTVTLADLTSPLVSVRLHGPAQAGTNSPPMIDLAPNGASTSVTGRAAISEAQIQYMLQGWSYVLAATRRYPNGELRGRVYVRRPRGSKPPG